MDAPKTSPCGGPPRNGGFGVDLAAASLVADSRVGGASSEPKQLRAIAEYLVYIDRTHFTKDEVQRFCRTNTFAKAIATRQNPYRVWRYYTKRLIELGVLTPTQGAN